MPESALIHFPMLAQTSASQSAAALATFVVYTLAVFALAGLAHKVLLKRQFLREYFLGSRGLGVIGFTLTYGATSASAGSFAGFPALVYTHGWILALWIASYMVVPLCGMGFFGKRFNQMARKTGAITIPELLGRRFESPAVGIVSTFMIVSMLSLYLIPQFKVAAYILRILLADVAWLDSAATGLARFTQNGIFRHVDPEYLICLILFAVLTVFYTTFGGFRAVVWTDVLQGCVMLLGVAVMLGLTLYQVGGLATATHKLAAMTPPEYGTVVFQAPESTPSDVRVERDTWFSIEDRETGGVLLLRTNELAILPAGQRQSNAVKVVRITTPEEIDEILSRFEGGTPPPLPASLSPGNIQLNQYAFGHGERGVYVSGPGPSRDEAYGFLPLGLAISFFFYWAISGTGQPGNLMRLMAFDSARTLRRSIAMLSVYFSLIYFPLVIIFCCARVLVPGLDQDADRIMPEMAFTLAKGASMPWLAGILVAAPFAAAMSTVDSFMLMISASVVRDVYQHKINPQATQRTIKILSYVCTMVVGVVVTLGSINPPQFLQYLIVFTSGGLAVTFLIPVGLALYWRRFNTAGALSSMFGGLGAYLALYVAGFIVYRSPREIHLFQMHPLVWGLAASLACALVVSLLTPPPPQELVARFFYRDDR